MNVNDEIVTLKKILNDLLNDESNEQKMDGTHVLTNYDYPINIYYNEDIKKEIKNILQDGKDILNKNSIGSKTDTYGNQSSLQSYHTIDEPQITEANEEDRQEESRYILFIHLIYTIGFVH